MALIHWGISSIDIKVVVKELEGLLILRKGGRISRPSFLKQWAVVRGKLDASPEYEAFRGDVISRAKGRCERLCGRPGKHVHHKVQISRDPSKALDPSNGEYVCVECHKSSHLHMR